MVFMLLSMDASPIDAAHDTRNARGPLIRIFDSSVQTLPQWGGEEITDTLRIARHAVDLWILTMSPAVFWNAPFA